LQQWLALDTQEVLQVCDDWSQVAASPGLAGGQSSFLQHSPHWSPHRFFAPQVKSHLFPSQLAVAPGGAGQGEQEVGPHEFTLWLSAHVPMQSCVPAGQDPLQVAVSAMHSP
jgi:hypothetical protein